MEKEDDESSSSSEDPESVLFGLNPEDFFGVDFDSEVASPPLSSVKKPKLPDRPRSICRHEPVDWPDQEILLGAHSIIREEIVTPLVNLIEIPGKGYGLGSKGTFKPRETIFTEQAALVLPLVPHGCLTCARSLATLPELPYFDECWPCLEHPATCSICGAGFCSAQCQTKFQQQYRVDCCTLIRLLQDFESVNEAILLAICLLLSRSGDIANKGLVGEASDVESLLSEDDLQKLESIYANLPITGPIDGFKRMIAVCCRNAVGITTQSPFSVYYQRLIAKVGRNTPSHSQVKESIAKYFGEEELTRAIDRIITEKVAVNAIAILPLTARINHSCNPNAHLSTAYVDAWVNIVANSNIRAGEEITISYLPHGQGRGKLSTVRRQNELEQRYLFKCTCELCVATR